MADETIANPPALAPLSPTSSLALLTDTLAPAEVVSAIRFAEAAKAENTRRAYASDWADSPIGRRRGAQVPALPAWPACELPRCAGRGRPPGVHHHPPRRAIAHQHRAAGFDPPTASPAVREVLRGIRHTLGTAPQSKTPATADLIARLLAACPSTLIGQRDRALIALGFAGAFAAPSCWHWRSRI